MARHYASLDVETTGFGKEDRIIEIGIVTFHPDEGVIDRFETLINPRREISSWGTRIHGLTTRDVSRAPQFEELAPLIAEQIDDSILVAHNAGFDARMVRQEFAQLGVTLADWPTLCTKKLAQRLPVGSANNKLKTLCDHLALGPFHFHSALDDAEACMQLLLKFGERHEGVRTRLRAGLAMPGVRLEGKALASSAARPLRRAA
jgi:DNA polymerase III epsilon subunit family exonuclease